MVEEEDVLGQDVTGCPVPFAEVARPSQVTRNLLLLRTVPELTNHVRPVDM